MHSSRNQELLLYPNSGLAVWGEKHTQRMARSFPFILEGFLGIGFRSGRMEMAVMCGGVGVAETNVDGLYSLQEKSDQ